MSQYEPVPVLSADFSGVVRLFPLPNLVMFPNVMQPLHIFEPRYCEMIEEALRGDRLITMALLASGWQSDYQGRPPIEPVVCIGQVLSHTRDPNGQYNILLLGARRARVVRELPPQRPFREALIEVMDDRYPASRSKRRPILQRKLLDGFHQVLPKTAVAQQQIEELLSHDVPLGMLTDIVAFTLPLALEVKQKLLSECNVDRRATWLLKQFDTLELEPGWGAESPEPPFPPPFSAN